MSKQFEERFWAKVDRGEAGECWNWKASTSGSRSRRGQVQMEGKMPQAHRVAFLLTHGRWPDPCCLHSCDNPLCVNPAHLREGTQQQNMTDAKLRGRIASGDRHWTRTHPERVSRGSRHYRAKLTELQVCGIVARWLQGETQQSIAKSLGVDPAAISNIVRGKSWKRVFEVGRA